MRQSTDQPANEQSVERIAMLFRLPRPWSLTEFLRWVGNARHRDIVLLPGKMSHDMCGLWVATATADYIAYEHHTSGPHTENIILHEVGHMVLSHPRDRLTGRARYSTREEREAEVFATTILRRAGQQAFPQPPPALRRIAESLDFRRSTTHGRGVPARLAGTRHPRSVPARQP